MRCPGTIARVEQIATSEPSAPHPRASGHSNTADGSRSPGDLHMRHEIERVPDDDLDRPLDDQFGDRADDWADDWFDDWADDWFDDWADDRFDDHLDHPFDGGDGSGESSTPLLLPIALAYATGVALAMWLGGRIDPADIAGLAGLESTENTTRSWELRTIRPWACAALIAGLLSLIAVVARRRRLALTALLIAAGALGALRLTAVVHQLPDDHLGRVDLTAHPAGLLVNLEVIAIETPRKIPRRGFLADFDHRPPRWRFRAAVVAVVDGTGAATTRRPMRGTISVSLAEDPGVGAGDRFSALGWLHAPRSPANPGEIDPRFRARLSGRVGTFVTNAGSIQPLGRDDRILASFWRLRGALRAHGDAVLRHALPRTLPEEPRGLIRAMLLGERHEGLDDLEPAFRRTGLAHLLAISGFHLAVLATAATVIARGRSSNIRRAAFAVMIGIIPYLLTVEAQPSVLRAGAMLLAAAAAATLGRGWSASGTFALALLAIIVPWPGDLARPGLQLSFAVVGGLIWIAPRIRTRWFAPSDRHASSFSEFMIEHLRSSAAIALTAWLVSTPLILFHFGMASPLAMPLSLVAIPIAATMLVLGHVMLITTPLLGDAAPLLGAVVGAIAEVLIAFVRHADGLPGVAVFRPAPSVAWLICALAAVGSLACAPHAAPRPRRRPRRPWPPRAERCRRVLIRVHDRVNGPLRRYGIPLLVLAILAWPLRPPAPLPSDVALRLDMLAVGDGTCLVLRTGDRTMLYDAGSTDLAIGGRTLVPALRALGVRRIDAIIVSHADIDHYAGIPELLNAFEIDMVVVTVDLIECVNERRGPVRRVFSEVARRGIPFERADSTTRWRWGPAEFTWLHPPAGWQAQIRNDHSQTILIDVAERSVLLCGDIEDDAIVAIREAHPQLRTDVVELPHHGSWRRPAREFMVALDPAIILQSTGRRRLESDRWAPYLAEYRPDANRLITARDGAVWVEISRDGTITSGRHWPRRADTVRMRHQVD